MASFIKYLRFLSHNKMGYLNNFFFPYSHVWWFRGPSIVAMVGLLFSNLDVMGSKHRNSLSIYGGKAAYIRALQDLANDGDLLYWDVFSSFYMWQFGLDLLSHV